MARYEILWRVLSLRCEEASRLSSESLDHDLASADRLAWRLHLLICVSCRRYRRDILALRRISNQMADSVDRLGTTLPDDARERIKRALKGD
jgi:hypothetical protein